MYKEKNYYFMAKRQWSILYVFYLQLFHKLILKIPTKDVIWLA